MAGGRGRTAGGVAGGERASTGTHPRPHTPFGAPRAGGIARSGLACRGGGRCGGTAKGNGIGGLEEGIAPRGCAVAGG